ncbi:MAG TPA: hypothetical protein VE954_39130 [Oligoflexus sp.]|uniref:hypothetical protein n=1 Tax=Oligoflexus sp. TaxID=1971216 RepID=UPI002D3BC165|nr:hypothetical protein [Oligoflexus sp.]HYX39156.1 hypothetical protein [Oligoflexus sp.]
MAHRRISVTIDAEVEDILKKRKKENESDGACIGRLVKEANAVAIQLEIVNLRADRTHDETRRMMTQFLTDVQRPFEQINNYLSEISDTIRKKT